MKDLMCESPEYFNIRHTERGVCTRNTRRPGNNIHCIMAFKRTEGFQTFYTAANPEIGREGYESNLEELDSSDSDWECFRRTVEEESHKGQSTDSVDAPDPLIGGLLSVEDSSSSELKVAASGLRRSGTFTKEAPTVCRHVKRESSDSDSQSSSLENTDSPSLQPESTYTDSTSNGVRRKETFVKETPVLQHEFYTDSTSDGGVGRRETFTKETPLLQHEFYTDSTIGGGVGRRETFTKETLELQHEFYTDSTSGVRRTGTFTKETPEVCVQKRRLSSSSDSDSSSVCMDDCMTASGGGLKRSGTFTKEKPTLDNTIDLDATLKATDFDLSTGSSDPEAQDT